MTDPLTDADLDAIEQRANAATEGPYRVDTIGGDPRVGVGILSHVIDYFLREGGQEQGFRDAEFLAHASSDVPALLAEVRRLRAMEQRVREYARHLARPFADGVPDREGEQIASELLAALDGSER